MMCLRLHIDTIYINHFLEFTLCSINGKILEIYAEKIFPECLLTGFIEA